MLDAKARAEIKINIIQDAANTPLQRDALALIETCEELEARLEEIAEEVYDANRQRKRYEIRCGDFRQQLADAEKRIKQTRDFFSPEVMSFLNARFPYSTELLKKALG